MTHNSGDSLDARFLSRINKILHAEIENGTIALREALEARDMELARERANLDAMQSEVIQQLTAIAGELHPRETALLHLLSERDQVEEGAPTSVEAGVGWLRLHGQAAIAEGAAFTAFEIAAALRWPDETLIRAAYRWLLDRDAEANALEYYSGRILDGLTRRKMLLEIAMSDEARARLRGDPGRGNDDTALRLIAYLGTFPARIRRALGTLCPRADEQQAWRAAHLATMEVAGERHARAALRARLDAAQKELEGYVTTARERRATWLKEMIPKG